MAMGTIIKAKRDGFRRAGLVHRTDGTYFPEGDLTEQQLEVLRNDPDLLVVEGVQEDALDASTDNSELVQQMGDTIAGLERALASASGDLGAVLEFQNQAPALIVGAVRALEPADPAQEGVLRIKEDDLVAIIIQHLPSPEAHNDGSKTLDNSGSPDAPSDSAPVPPVPAAPGADAALKAEKAPGKRAGKNGGGE